MDVRPSRTRSRCTSSSTTGVIASLQTRFEQRNALRLSYDAESNHAGKLIAVDGKIYVIGASLLLPDSHDPKLLAYKPYVAIGTHELSQQELVALSQRYMVSEISLVQPGQPRPQGSATVAFHDDNTGKVIAELAWMPETPGRTLFIRTLGPVLMISLGLGLIAIVLLHQSQKAAQGLIASEAKAKHMALHDNRPAERSGTSCGNTSRGAGDRARASSEARPHPSRHDAVPA